MNRAVHLVSVCLLGFARVAISGQTAQKATVSVAKTEAPGVAQWQPSMGDGLAQMFITEFAKLDNFKVVESVALDDLRAEQALGKHGEVADSESVKTGNWQGADYTFKSTVTRFGSEGSTIGIPTPVIRWKIRKTKNEVQIDWRIIENSTRNIVESGRDSGTEEGKSVDLGVFVDSKSEFMASALGKATMKAISSVVAKVATLNLPPCKRASINQNNVEVAKLALRSIKGTVKLVDGKQVWVSLGATNGFAVGDKVRIYRVVEKKNKKGEVVATTYEAAADIILLKVQKDKSVGEYTGTAQISEDWAAADAALDIEKLE